MNAQDLENLTIAGLAAEIKNRSISPVEVTRLFLERIERINPLLNAYVTVNADIALTEAKRAETEIARALSRPAPRHSFFHQGQHCDKRHQNHGRFEDFGRLETGL
jgi:Asp-tRNAAsn/Glu-tRNAGln amidotransferase A subunit and related amidases